MLGVEVAAAAVAAALCLVEVWTLSFARPCLRSVPLVGVRAVLYGFLAYVAVLLVQSGDPSVKKITIGGIAGGVIIGLAVPTLIIAQDGPLAFLNLSSRRDALLDSPIKQRNVLALQERVENKLKPVLAKKPVQAIVDRFCDLIDLDETIEAHRKVQIIDQARSIPTTPNNEEKKIKAFIYFAYKQRHGDFIRQIVREDRPRWWRRLPFFRGENKESA